MILINVPMEKRRLNDVETMVGISIHPWNFNDGVTKNRSMLIPTC
jgi:hypothetical protein